MHDVIQGQFRQVSIIENQPQDILCVDKSHQIVTMRAVHRDPRVPETAELLDHFRDRHAHIQKRRARPRGHDLDNLRVTRFQQVVNQGTLGRIEFPFPGNLLHQGSELIQMKDVLGGLFFTDYQGGNAVGNTADGPDQRCNQANPDAHGGCDHPGTDTHRV